MDVPKQVPSPIYLRITPEVFQEELVRLGFTKNDAEEIVSWLQVISEQKIGGKSGWAFLSSKTSNVIKSSLAYIGSLILSQPHYFDLTQHRIEIYFNVQSACNISRTYEELLEFLRQKDPAKFAVNKDTKKKYWVERSYFYDI